MYTLNNTCSSCTKLAMDPPQYLSLSKLNTELSLAIRVYSSCKMSGNIHHTSFTHNRNHILAYHGTIQAYHSLIQAYQASLSCPGLN